MPLVNPAVAYGQYVKLFKRCTINNTATYAFNTFGRKVIKTALFWPKCKNLHTANVANRKPQNPPQSEKVPWHFCGSFSRLIIRILRTRPQNPELAWLAGCFALSGLHLTRWSARDGSSTREKPQRHLSSSLTQNPEHKGLHSKWKVDLWYWDRRHV